jgi:hypothetical protein
VFRSLSTIEKCLVRLDRAEQNLVFELTCMSDAKKVITHLFQFCTLRHHRSSGNNNSRFAFLSTTRRRRVKFRCRLHCLMVSLPPPNKYVGQTRRRWSSDQSSFQLSEYLSNFQTVIPEITLAPCASGLSLKSFMSNQSVSVEGAGARALYTNMDLPSSIFADYRVPFAEPMELTVTLREFKAFVAFGDVIARPLVIKFTSTGQPIALSMTGTVGFSADMMLATVSNAEDDATASAVSGAATAAAPVSVKKAPVVKKQPAKSLPTTGNNAADDENSSSYYYSYDTSVTNDAGAPPPSKTVVALPPVTKKEKVTAPKAAPVKSVAVAAARRTSSAQNDMLIDNTEQVASDTGRTGERAPHPCLNLDADDEQFDFPPSPTRAVGVDQLFREPSPEI